MDQGSKESKRNGGCTKQKGRRDRRISIKCNKSERGCKNDCPNGSTVRGIKQWADSGNQTPSRHGRVGLASVVRL